MADGLISADDLACQYVAEWRNGGKLLASLYGAYLDWNEGPTGLRRGRLRRIQAHCQKGYD